MSEKKIQKTVFNTTNKGAFLRKMAAAFCITGLLLLIGIQVFAESPTKGKQKIAAKQTVVEPQNFPTREKPLIIDEKGKRVLSFCFVDPFNLNIKFNTIKKLANNGNIDFLILLALPMDAKRNMSHYIKSGNNKLDEFLDNPNWRVEWLQAKKKGEPLMLFLSEQYAVNMANLGYIKLPINKMVPIRSYEKNLPLYYLAFFSRNEKGYIFWKQVLQYSRKQPELPFEIDWSIK